MRCTFHTRAGTLCKNPRIPGKEFCVTHRQYTVRALIGAPLLHSAVYDNKMCIVRLSLARGAAIHEPMSDGWTPLHVAAFYGRPDAARTLLEHNARVDARADLGETPLHFAADRGHVAVARLLLEHGADPDARDNDDLAPMDYADTVELLTLLRGYLGG